MQQPQNSYDLQRQKVRDEEQNRRKQEQAALQRRLAGRGFTAGSGYTESQQAQTDIAARQGERTRLGDVDIAEAGAGEQRAENERQREWMGGQNSETRKLEERRLTNDEKQQAWAQGMTEDQFVEQKLQNLRGYGLEVEGLNQRQQEIDDAANNFSNKLEFDYWATEAGYSDADRQRAWAERQGTLERNAATETNRENQDFQAAFAEFGELLARGRMELENTINIENAGLKMRTDSMYNLGLSGEKINTENLSPIESDAYNMGLAGKSKSDYDFMIQDQISKRNLMIVTSIEDEGTKSDIIDMWDTFNIGG
jgi:hypothetical protein